MNRETLLNYYERLTWLVEKLPGGLQKPILQELVPIRQLFLEQRPANLLLLGDPGPDAREFLLSIALLGQAAAGRRNPGAAETSATSGDSPAQADRPDVSILQLGDVENGWRMISMPDRGTVRVLDLRDCLDLDVALERALKVAIPDVVLFFSRGDAGIESAAAFQAILAKISGLPEKIAAFAPQEPQPVKAKKGIGSAVGAPPPPAMVAVSTAEDQPAGVERLRALLHSRRELVDWNLRVLSAGDLPGIGKAISAFLPNQARMEFALFGSLREVQVEIARSLLKSFTAVCGVIGMQPIPLADLPILTTLQSLMVGLIAYTSGRRLGPRAIAEFFGAVGINFGLGMMFRETARGIIKVVPGFGNVVSGMVAGAGTYAIGRAAIAYFIEQVPARETRRLFEKIRPHRTTFLRRLPMPRRKDDDTPPADATPQG